MSVKRWVIGQPDGTQAAQLAEECGIHPFLALLLTTRGIADFDSASDFLLNGEVGDDPYAFADMDLAVERVQRALDNHEKIAVYGDYDADGITSTVLLYTFLKAQGADVIYEIPLREGEGYGLHESAVRRLAGEGVSLLITVDNGIAAQEEVARAGELGIDVVVTDHHQPQDSLPPAVAVVDPHRTDCGSEFKDYAGVGVAYKLLAALDGDADALLETYGDLVALGTLADVMPLKGENRRLVQQGLRVMAEKKRPGIAALMEAAGIAGKPLTSTAVVFTLAPRINAAGRMGCPDKAARLLLTEDEEEARRLAAEIQQLNADRQAAEASILEEVLERLHRRPELLAPRVLVLEGEGWHPGVLGIIAARLLELYGKPCLVLSVENGVAKGSGRSLPGFPLFEALAACKGCLSAFGGHALAAGVTVEAARLDEFREAVNAYAAERLPRMPAPELPIDFRLRPSQIDREKLELLSLLEPCGAGNPAPVFGLFHMRLDNITPVGGGRHLRLSLSRDGVSITAMKFQTPPEAFPVPCGAVLHLAVTLDKNEYRGTVTPSIVIKDIRYADTRQEELLDALDGFERIRRREWKAREAIPSREALAGLYRFLRAAGTWQGTLEQLLPLARQAGGPAAYLPLRAALEVFREAGLLDVQERGERLRLTILPAGGKADLHATPLLQYLQS